MKKRLACLLSALMAILVFITPFHAAAKQETSTPPLALSDGAAAVQVRVDGKPVDFGPHRPWIDGGWTVAPLEPLFEALNIRFDRDGTEGEAPVFASKLGLALRMQPGSDIAEVNGTEQVMHTSAQWADGTLYVPLRFVAESAGFEVQWEESTRTAVLERKYGGRGFLWEVEHNGNTVYLLGSVHLADDSFYPLDPAIEFAFDAADYIGVEIDLGKAADPEIVQLMLASSTLQDGSTLQDHISAETYRLLGEKLAELGLPEHAFDTFKPWLAALTLGALAYGEAGMQAESGIDMYVLASAAARDIPILELESFESQLDMFNRFSPELQEQMLRDALEPSAGESGEEIAKLAEIWKGGDDNALQDIIRDMETEDGEYRRLMLTDRNKAMAAKIETYLNGTEPAVYLIVVGAAHMLGEDGIVPLLEQAGYTVTRK